MRGRALIITGTAAAGKTYLARELVQTDPGFEQVRAVTTRSPRKDDHGQYDYLSLDAFKVLVEQNALLVKAQYTKNQYGIRRADLQAAVAKGKTPILIITPESAIRLMTGNAEPDAPEEYLSVFVDASDVTLDRRLAAREDGKSDEERSAKVRALDREWAVKCTYHLQSEDDAPTPRLVQELWSLQGTGGVLPGRMIRLMLKCGMLMQEASIRSVSGASYDLVLGDEYFYGGRILRLDDDSPILMIEPYDYAIVTSREVPALPRDVCGRFDLAVSLFAQGLILSNGPQVDPGFTGPLFCLLFNTSSSPVLLKRGKHYATLEFHKLFEPTSPYEGKYRGKSLLDYLPANAARGAINELKQQLEELRSESRNLRDLTWAIMALVMALLAIWISVK